MGALKKIKGGKAAGMDGIVLKMLKDGGISIIDWLLRIFNRLFGVWCCNRGLEGNVYRPGIQTER